MLYSHQGLNTFKSCLVKHSLNSFLQFIKAAFVFLLTTDLAQMKALKDPSQPPPFSMPSKLLTLHGEAKSYCFTVSCVPESMFHYL